MQVTKCSALALAIAAAASQQAFASAQSESEGFVEGSSASLLNRNYYFTTAISATPPQASRATPKSGPMA